MIIELFVRNFLKTKLKVGIHLEVTSDPTFVLVEKVGGYENRLKYATIAIQSYAPRREQAILLNEEVKKAMNLFIELDEIVKVELNQDYDFTDTQTKKYRYQAVYDITYY